MRKESELSDYASREGEKKHKNNFRISLPRCLSSSFLRVKRSARLFGGMMVRGA